MEILKNLMIQGNLKIEAKPLKLKEFPILIMVLR